MLCKELARNKDVDWLDIPFAPLRRYHNTELYHGYSPSQLFLLVTSVGGTSRTILLGIFLMTLRLVKKRPGPSLRDFR